MDIQRVSNKPLGCGSVSALFPLWEDNCEELCDLPRMFAKAQIREHVLENSVQSNFDFVASPSSKFEGCVSVLVQFNEKIVGNVSNPLHVFLAEWVAIGILDEPETLNSFLPIARCGILRVAKCLVLPRVPKMTTLVLGKR